MKLIKANRLWNYKTLDLTPFHGPEYLERLGTVLDEAGKQGWELCHLTDTYMVLKQLWTHNEGAGD